MRKFLNDCNFFTLSVRAKFYELCYEVSRHPEFIHALTFYQLMTQRGQLNVYHIHV